MSRNYQDVRKLLPGMVILQEDSGVLEVCNNPCAFRADESLQDARTILQQHGFSVREAANYNKYDQDFEWYLVVRDMEGRI